MLCKQQKAETDIIFVLCDLCTVLTEFHMHINIDSYSM